MYLKHIYRHASGASSVISRGMKESLIWWGFLAKPFARDFAFFSESVDVVVHTDASLDGLGVALHYPRTSHVFASKAPRGFADSLGEGESAIYILELAAALLGADMVRRLAPSWGGAKNVVLSIDNNAALVALLRGYARSNLACGIIQKFWRAQCDSLCSIWINRVRSSANSADAASRGKCVNPTWVEFPELG